MSNEHTFRDFYDIFELAEYLKIDLFPLPVAEALIPLNPQRWPAHAAGSILGQDLKNADSVVGKPFTNIATTKQYLTSAHNSSHFRSRAREVAMDTLDVNTMSEFGDFAGTTASGVYANWIADKKNLAKGNFTIGNSPTGQSPTVSQLNLYGQENSFRVDEVGLKLSNKSN